jgi:beta-glucosidase
VVNYDEGAKVGYKWFHAMGEKPLFPFGFGVSHTTFSLGELRLTVDGARVIGRASVSNTGHREGAAIPQLYLTDGSPKSQPMRLLGWKRVNLKPGETREIEILVDPRLLATFDEKARSWKISPGGRLLALGFDSEHFSAERKVTLRNFNFRRDIALPTRPRKMTVVAR